jgi:hypothetical protein
MAVTTGASRTPAARNGRATRPSPLARPATTGSREAERPFRPARRPATGCGSSTRSTRLDGSHHASIGSPLSGTSRPSRPDPSGPPLRAPPDGSGRS